jgi:hypothetical protein
MKAILSLFLLTLFTLPALSQETKKIHTPDPNKKILTVDASCGQCNFGLKDKKGCDLAVRIDGKAYFVEGTKIDEHGDAHAEDGFCEAIRKAEVQGEVKDNKFKVTYFKLLPAKKEN